MRRWAVAALSALGAAREEIDALNVFPVADGDTGTNLFLTLESAVAAAASAEAAAACSGGPVELAELASRFAEGALLGARGNSGVILAQLCAAWAEVARQDGPLGAAAARRAFALADVQAWDAVGSPVEGTVLSVSRAAARASAEAGPALADVVTAAVTAAREALTRTRDQLPVLREAGVVDAGGRGLVVLLDALEDIVEGRPAGRHPGRGHRRPGLPRAGGHGETGASGYEVMFLLEAEDAAVHDLRLALGALGTSVVVVGGHGRWHVHAHVADAGAAVEAGVAAGRPSRIRISRLQAGHAAAAEPAAPPAALVACAAGPGLAQLFGEVGARVVLTGPGARPTTSELLQAVQATAARRVAILPNDGDTFAVAQVAGRLAREDGVQVRVLPTRAQVQGLAAAAVHDPARDFEDDVVRMSAAAGAARDGAVTLAARDGITMGGPCRAGDALGVVQGDFLVVAPSLEVAAVDVVDRLLSGGGELLTVVTGAECPPGLPEAVVRHVRSGRTGVEIVVLDGGQRRYPLLLGVE